MFLYSSFEFGSTFGFRVSNLFLPEGGGHDVVSGGIAGKRGNDGATAQDGDAVAHAKDFGEIGGNHQDGKALGGEATNEFVDFGFCADVDALSGFVEDEDFGFCREP